MTSDAVTTDTMRFALVNADGKAVASYLPSNYSVLRTSTASGAFALVGGKDSSGWTMHDYVLPRLGSFLHFGKEIAAEELTPDPTASDFVDFLRYMAADDDASLIVDIVEKPHAFGPEYRDYLALGGIDR